MDTLVVPAPPIGCRLPYSNALQAHRVLMSRHVLVLPSAEDNDRENAKD